MANDIAKLLYEGALAVSQGRRAEAQILLMQALELDEHNEQAWLWLSGAVEQPADQEIALENVLALNPNNAAAQEGLRVLRSQISIANATPAEWQPPAPQEEWKQLSCTAGNAAQPYIALPNSAGNAMRQCTPAITVSTALNSAVKSSKG